MITQNIGPGHKLFNPNHTGYTQVLVLKNDVVIAQFYGFQAKRHAALFVRQLKKSIDK